MYTLLDEVSVEAGTCYVPRAPNNPLFDAFFYEIPPDGADPAAEVILWILQVTVKTSHIGRADGFAIVEKLQTRAATETGRAVRIKYVLVVPRGLDRRVWTYSVEWRMAKEFDRVRGEVYVQFLRLDRLPDRRRPAVG